MTGNVTNFSPSGVQASFFIGSNFMTQGNTWFVKPYSGSDGNSGKTPNRAFKTLAKALASATANQNDIVYFFAESNSASGTTDYQSTALDWNKDMVHLVGVNSGAQIGQRSRIAQLSTVKTIEDLFTVSAKGCLIQNFEVFQGVASSTATSPRAFVETGMRNHFVNCQFSGNGDTAGSTDTAGARSAVFSANSESLYENCYFGLDTVIRSTQTAEVEFAGASTRNLFRKCYFNTYCDSTGFLPITVAATLDRFAIFEDCKFLCAENITSAATPAVVFGGSITTINGVIHLVNPYTNCTQYAPDSTRVKALGHDGTATGNLIGIAQTIDAA